MIGVRAFLPALCSLVAAASCLAAPATAQTNLLRNPGAQAGAASAHGWDSVTIPGWQVVSGLPTVVRYGTKGFPRGTPRGQLFAGGPGGTARLQQRVALRTRGGAPAAGARYSFSGRLGGSSSSRASAGITFLTVHASLALASRPRPSPSRGREPPPRSGATAYIMNTISGTITPVDVASGHAGAPISVGTYAYPTQIIPASDGRTAVVLGTYAGTVRLLDTRAHGVWADQGRRPARSGSRHTLTTNPDPRRDPSEPVQPP